MLVAIQTHSDFWNS